MKFEDLYKKIRAIDEGAEVAPIEAEGIEIIGGPMGGMLGGLGGMSHSSPPPQQNNVSMNVSLNGAGAGGVRDLMDILHNIESGTDHDDSHNSEPAHHEPDHEEPIMGDMIDAMASEGMNNNVEEFFRKVANSDDGSDMLYHAQVGKYGRELEQAVQDKYDDISINAGLHGDDDFEQIHDRMMDNIQADYGNRGTDNQELGELTAEYPGGSTNFSTGEVKGTHTPEKEVEEEMGDDGETWANSTHGDAGAHTHGVDAVTFTGDDMNSKGGSSPLSRAPGSNSLIRHHWHVQEGLVGKLAAMYEEIKGEPMVESVSQMLALNQRLNQRLNESEDDLSYIAPEPEAPSDSIAAMSSPSPQEKCGPEVKAQIMAQKTFNAAYAIAKKAACPEFDWCQIVTVPSPGSNTSDPWFNAPGMGTGSVVTRNGKPTFAPVKENEQLIPATEGLDRMREIAGTQVVMELNPNSDSIPEIKAGSKEKAIEIARNKGIKTFKFCGKYKVQAGRPDIAPMPTQGVPSAAVVGNPTISRQTAPGNPNTRPGSLRDRAAQANAARRPDAPRF